MRTISEFSRAFAATLVCYGVNGLFLFVLTGFVFNVIFHFHSFHYHSNIHACKESQISHSSSYPFIRRPFTIPPIYLSI